MTVYARRQYIYTLQGHKLTFCSLAEMTDYARWQYIAFKKKILVFSEENVALKGQNVYLIIGYGLCLDEIVRQPVEMLHCNASTAVIVGERKTIP